jgi:diaminohydroxyphosphoribosylaminopyrimidine deaminase/5-amino-6-(5-phosphoribosylamino)uracil reductase
MTTNEQYMLRAIELAGKGEGLTRPNPPVGAVLVLDGAIVAEGWHERAGGPHAEVNCLGAWSRAHGTGSLKSATLYLTLEPCSSHGRTPPCTDLILEKGIGRVVVAATDPNPHHAGRGLKILSDAGVEVIDGVCAEQGAALIAPFSKFISKGMPFVTLKMASTLDGRIADRNGDSKWITGTEAREHVQAMRRRADAIMVGAGTVRADDPSLLPRPDEERRPWRVIVGSDIPEAANVLTDEAAGRTLVLEMEGHRPRGLQTAGPPSLQITSLSEGLRMLAERYDVMHALCEGGGKLAAALMEEGLVDEFAFFIAPKFMGSDGLPNFGKSGGLIGNTLNLIFTSCEQMGEDVLIKAKPER